MKNLKANIYNLLVEAGVAEEQAKELAKKTYKKTKKCIKNKKTEDTINKMVDAAVDGIPNLFIASIAYAINAVMLRLFALS